nr:MAG: hypothetical protein KatS3mg041_1219 [Bacteroidota bacterium]
MLRTLTQAELRTLQRIRSYPAISVLLPTARAFPESQQNPVRLRDLLREAEQRLLQELGKREAVPYIERLHALAEAVPWDHPRDGLAIFVNADYSGVFWLPFSVSPQVVIDETFATRDLVRTLNRSLRYWVLALSENHTRLWAGFRDQLQEVGDHGFPMRFEMPAKVISQPGPIAADDGEYWQEQYRHFCRRIDQAFAQVAGSEEQPLVVFGVDRWLALFREVSAHAGWIVATFPGSPDHEPEHELARKSWEAVLRHIEEKRLELIRRWNETPPARRAEGLEAVWQAMIEGRTHMLLIEEGFHQPGRIGEDGLRIERLPEHRRTEPGVVDDLVDELLERALAKGARAWFVPNESLREHGRIVAFLRY